jgi:cell division protein FtsA
MTLRKPRPRTGPIAALDIGSTKIACFVARSEGQATRIVGVGHQISQGVRAGAIIDMEGAAAAITNAVYAAEQIAGETLKSVIVGTSCGQPVSHGVSVDVAIAGHEVTEADLRRVTGLGRGQETDPARKLLHAIPVSYAIDGSRGIRDPRGMCGERLGVRMHLVSAEASALRNLEAVIGRCHLDVENFVVAPYAAGLASLVEDEMDLGVTVIDMGGGVTSMAVFIDGHAVWTDSVPLGGGHVTSDSARGLSTPLTHAERMKTLYGSCITAGADEREVIDVPLVGEEEHDHANHVSKSILTGIIRPRIEETFEYVRARLEASGYHKTAGRRVVLTGGASQLNGVRELAATILDKQVRAGRPIGIQGLSDQTGGPAFAVCAGLIAHALAPQEALRTAAAPARPANGWMGRFGLWLRENL